jgi:hypothetical protein
VKVSAQAEVEALVKVLAPAKASALVAVLDALRRHPPDVRRPDLRLGP